jgi:hypothetical protein
VSKEALIVRVLSAGTWNAERATFELKSDMLQQAARREILCEEMK